MEKVQDMLVFFWGGCACGAKQEARRKGTASKDPHSVAACTTSPGVSPQDTITGRPKSRGSRWRACLHRWGPTWRGRPVLSLSYLGFDSWSEVQLKDVIGALLPRRCLVVASLPRRCADLVGSLETDHAVALTCSRHKPGMLHPWPLPMSLSMHLL